jgi:hypothetical protein
MEISKKIPCVGVTSEITSADVVTLNCIVSPQDLKHFCSMQFTVARDPNHKVHLFTFNSRKGAPLNRNASLGKGQIAISEHELGPEIK